MHYVPEMYKNPRTFREAPAGGTSRPGGSQLPAHVRAPGSPGARGPEADVQLSPPRGALHRRHRLPERTGKTAVLRPPGRLVCTPFERMRRDRFPLRQISCFQFQVLFYKSFSVSALLSIVLAYLARVY